MFLPYLEVPVSNFSQPGSSRQPVQAFQARFDGDCPTCFEAIYEGDMIGYLPGDDKPSCEECVDNHNEELY